MMEEAEGIPEIPRGPEGQGPGGQRQHKGAAQGGNAQKTPAAGSKTEPQPQKRQSRDSQKGHDMAAQGKQGVHILHMGLFPGVEFRDGIQGVSVAGEVRAQSVIQFFHGGPIYAGVDFQLHLSFIIELPADGGGHEGGKGQAQGKKHGPQDSHEGGENGMISQESSSRVFRPAGFAGGPGADYCICCR